MQDGAAVLLALNPIVSLGPIIFVQFSNERASTGEDAAFRRVLWSRSLQSSDLKHWRRQLQRSVR